MWALGCSVLVVCRLHWALLEAFSRIFGFTSKFAYYLLTWILPFTLSLVARPWLAKFDPNWFNRNRDFSLLDAPCKMTLKHSIKLTPDSRCISGWFSQFFNDFSRFRWYFWNDANFVTIQGQGNISTNCDRERRSFWFCASQVICWHRKVTQKLSIFRLYD